MRLQWGSAIVAVLLAFTGLSSQEIVNDLGRGKGFKPPTPEKRRAAYQRDKAKNGERVAVATKMAAPPAKFDATDMGWVPPIEDQGSCGSCYGVATADQLTCAFIKAGYQKNDGSFAIRFQYGLDCQDFGGCNGGWGYEVAEWMQQNGFPAEHYVDAKGAKLIDYPPYVARPQTCREKVGAKRWKPADIGLCAGSSGRAATVLEIKTCLMQYGVINIAFNANSAYSNATTNVVTVKGGANHETTLVGWDDSKSAWKTRGNWGTGLGDKGYVWMSWTSDIEDPFWMTANALPPPPDPDPPGPGPIPPIGQLVITPASVTIAPKGMQQFTSVPPADIWITKSGGTVTQTGMYAAPDVVGTYNVVAITISPFAVANAMVTVSLTPPPPVGPQIVLTQDMPKGVYIQLRPGMELAPLGTTAELERIRAAVNALLPPKVSNAEPPVIEKKVETKESTAPVPKVIEIAPKLVNEPAPAVSPSKKKAG